MEHAKTTTRAAALAAALFLISSPLQADTMLIADFTTPETAQDWRFFSDQVMGGVSTGQATVTNGALRLTGAVSTKNNGGFIQARLGDVALSPDATAFTIRAKGDGQTYYLHLRTNQTRRPWHYYQAEFVAGPEWQNITVPLSAFEPSASMLPATPDPQSVRTVALVAYGRDHQADVSLAQISAE